ncbi:unnamed protein product [Cyberlindnera jadinii]|uniref:Uncharacterized protein n=1 Tax=Cyberlindnera jadinii (strain ATCC 18201 / CBS 1600 / BCRC 20928 / JCM 3617 / NBRC 0987 / NRRL Y-1542) TaxID=983966 RepID=A0A0H5C9K7_CYBJN|nr:unnamed protein product [Cyberlindnera jadinii]
MANISKRRKVEEQKKVRDKEPNYSPKERDLIAIIYIYISRLMNPQRISDIAEHTAKVYNMHAEKKVQQDVIRVRDENKLISKIHRMTTTTKEMTGPNRPPFSSRMMQRAINEFVDKHKASLTNLKRIPEFPLPSGLVVRDQSSEFYGDEEMASWRQVESEIFDSALCVRYMVNNELLSADGDSESAEAVAGNGDEKPVDKLNKKPIGRPSKKSTETLDEKSGTYESADKDNDRPTGSIGENKGNTMKTEPKIKDKQQKKVVSFSLPESSMIDDDHKTINAQKLNTLEEGGIDGEQDANSDDDDDEESDSDSVDAKGTTKVTKVYHIQGHNISTRKLFLTTQDRDGSTAPQTNHSEITRLRQELETLRGEYTDDIAATRNYCRKLAKMVEAQNATIEDLQDRVYYLEDKFIYKDEVRKENEEAK